MWTHGRQPGRLESQLYHKSMVQRNLNTLYIGMQPLRPALCQQKNCAQLQATAVAQLQSYKKKKKKQQRENATR